MCVQITCTNKGPRCISWWACEPSTSWCKDTSPPYSLRRQDMCVTEVVSITVTGGNMLNFVPTVQGASRRPFKCHIQSAVTHWLARRLQLLQCSLEAGKENRIRFGKHLSSDPHQWLTGITRPDLKCDLWEEDHYQPAGFGLQLWALWNRNHMRGVFRSTKTNTLRLNRN